MRRANRFVACGALLGAVVLAAGCDAVEAKPSAGVATAENTRQHMQKARKESTEAVQATKDYAYAARDELVKDIQNDLAAINGALLELSAKADRSAKADAKAKLQALRDGAAKLTRELEKVNTAQEAAWDHVKADLRKSNEDLKSSVAQARVWLSDKVAP